MKIVNQHSFNQKQPAALRPTELPGRIISYEEASEMSRQLDLYFMKKRNGWVTGKAAFNPPMRKKLVDKKRV
jgi:hypothetical protein